jgi:hypothetical protein
VSAPLGRERERRQRVSREDKAKMECSGGGRRASDQCTSIA